MKLYLYCFLLSAVCLLNACVQEMPKDEPSSIGSIDQLSVDEAQAYFQKHIEQYGTTRSAENGQSNGLTPGEFTPQWKSAETSYNKIVANVDVPIIPQYKYRAIRSEMNNGKAEAYSVGIIQKLVVTKILTTKKLGLYLITLIPDHTYYERNKNNFGDRFVSCKSEMNYSGWVIYSLPQVDIPIAAKYYKDGKTEMKFIIPKVDGRSNVGSKVFLNFLSGIKFARANSMHTRSSGEDDYSSFGEWFMNEIWPDASDGDHFTMYEDENGWYLEDQDGNRYDIPDGVGSGYEDDEDEDLFPDWSEPDDGFDGGYGNDDSSLGIAVYCPYCGTYLGSMLLEDWENGVYYCPRCKKYVSIFFG